jgi:hypothetical protein
MTDPIQQTLTPNNQPVQQSPQAKPSRQNLYIGIGIILIVMIVGVLFIAKRSNPNTPAPVSATIQNTNPNVHSNMNATTPEINASNALPPGKSDAQLNQDLQSMDTSLNLSDINIRNVDQGLNDQQTNLAE